MQWCILCAFQQPGSTVYVISVVAVGEYLPSKRGGSQYQVSNSLLAHLGEGEGRGRGRGRGRGGEGRGRGRGRGNVFITCFLNFSGGFGIVFSS